MRFPEAFTVEMNQLFSDWMAPSDADAFWQSLDQPSASGLRANSLKISRDDLRRLLVDLTGVSADQFPDVPWADDGLYIPDTLQPGQLSLYAAGLYYIQEPSAMLPAAALAVRPGEKVLDVCAAPGGKASRLTSDLQGEGFVWANDLSQRRTRALLRNLEMNGGRNSLITCASPDQLAAHLPAYFDAILVDAPCSGSGMFRDDPVAIRSWLDYGPAASVPVQRDILASAWHMLKPGGRLVYSTCSFSVAENEDNILWFLERCPNASLLPIEKPSGVSDGLPLSCAMSMTARIWPHQTRGDGHFCALLAKHDSNPSDGDIPAAFDRLTEASPEQKDSLERFFSTTLSGEGLAKMTKWLRMGWLRQENGHLHLLPRADLPLSQVSKVKTGLFLGQIRPIRNQPPRFEPSQALLMALDASDLRCVFPTGADSDQIRRYLRGETIQWQDTWPADTTRYAAIALATPVGMYPVGWLKADQPPVLKNLYPQGWRRSS